MKALKAFENRFDEQVDGFCNALEQRYEKNGNMFDFSEYLRSEFLIHCHSTLC